MVNRIGFALLWLGFVTYAFTLAPPFQPGTFDLIIRLSSGQWDGINPMIIALFNLMGVWPMAYACLMLPDGVGQKLAAWPFVAFSFGVGAFTILPYLALRESNQTFDGPKTAVLKVVDSRWTGRAIAFSGLILLTYGLTQGDWSDFARQWQTSQFIHVMSLDFCMLCAIVAPLIKDDMAKRNLNNPSLFWTATLVPLLGTLFYLSIRPSLEAEEPDLNSAAEA